MTSDQLPALLGGTPVRPQGPPDWPVSDSDIQHALVSAWKQGIWGKYHADPVCELEKELATFHHVPHALTCGSGTFAIELALRAIRVQQGDEVILSAYDYPGNFLTVHALEAKPVLIDILPQNACMNPDGLPSAISDKTKAIIVSHLHGGIVPMRRVMTIAQDHGLPVIEDAAQCPGAMVEGKLAGSWGDFGVVSFGGSKLLTAGRGGALLSTDARLFQRARLIQNRSNNLVCPLSQLQAVVLRPQLTKLLERNAHRFNNVRYLQDALKDIPGLRLFENDLPECEPAFYKVGFYFNAEEFGISRERFVKAMRAEGIAMDVGFRALHVQRSPTRYRKPGSLFHANVAHQQIVKLHHPVLLEGQNSMDEIVTAIQQIHAHREQI